MKRLLISLAILLFPALAIAQNNNNKNAKDIRDEKKAKIEAEVKKIIESGNFVFIVRTAKPLGGLTINLDSDYEIRLSGDSVYAGLPYYGEAYRINYGSNEGGIKLNDLMYNYRLNYNEKKQYYEFRFEVIKPNDTYKIYLDISSSGYGNLKIQCNSRQGISYDGILLKLLD